MNKIQPVKNGAKKLNEAQIDFIKYYLLKDMNLILELKNKIRSSEFKGDRFESIQIAKNEGKKFGRSRVFLENFNVFFDQFIMDSTDPFAISEKSHYKKLQQLEKKYGEELKVENVETGAQATDYVLKDHLLWNQFHSLNVSNDILENFTYVNNTLFLKNDDTFEEKIEVANTYASDLIKLPFVDNSKMKHLRMLASVILGILVTGESEEYFVREKDQTKIDTWISTLKLVDTSKMNISEYEEWFKNYDVWPLTHSYLFDASSREYFDEPTDSVDSTINVHDKNKLIFSASKEVKQIYEDSWEEDDYEDSNSGDRALIDLLFEAKALNYLIYPSIDILKPIYNGYDVAKANIKRLNQQYGYRLEKNVEFFLSDEMEDLLGDHRFFQIAEKYVDYSYKKEMFDVLFSDDEEVNDEELSFENLENIKGAASVLLSSDFEYFMNVSEIQKYIRYAHLDLDEFETGINIEDLLPSEEEIKEIYNQWLFTIPQFCKEFVDEFFAYGLPLAEKNDAEIKAMIKERDKRKK